MSYIFKLTLTYYRYIGKCRLTARNITENWFLSQLYFLLSNISPSYLYDCYLDIILRFLTPKTSYLDTKIIKIYHMDQKIWNKADSFIFGGGQFEKKIQYGRHQELIAAGTPLKKWCFRPLCKYFDPKARSYDCFFSRSRSLPLGAAPVPSGVVGGSVAAVVTFASCWFSSACLSAPCSCCLSHALNSVINPRHLRLQATLYMPIPSPPPPANPFLNTSIGCGDLDIYPTASKATGCIAKKSILIIT